jgi:hypothetical protein
VYEAKILHKIPSRCESFGQAGRYLIVRSVHGWRPFKLVRVLQGHEAGAVAPFAASAQHFANCRSFGYHALKIELELPGRDQRRIPPEMFKKSFVSG